MTTAVLMDQAVTDNSSSRPTVGVSDNTCRGCDVYHRVGPPPAKRYGIGRLHCTTCHSEHHVAIEDGPWGDLNGKPLDTRRLGWRLKQYGVKAKKIRTGDKTPKGYIIDQFDDAFARYLPVPETRGTDEERGTVDRNDVPLVPDVPLSQGMGQRTLDCCSVCDSAEISGYTPEGEPRCAGHYPLPDDGPLVREAVAVGLAIVARGPAFDLGCDANAPDDFREAGSR